MAKEFCDTCEKETIFSKAKIEIPVGRLKFSTATLVCTNCKSYEMTPQIRDEMDKWGEGMGNKFIDFQPKVSAVTLEILDRLSEKYAVGSRAGMIRCLVGIYLTSIVHWEHYNRVNKILEEHEVSKLLDKGKKKPESVSVKYSTYKRLSGASETWKMTPALIIEEAVRFCLGVLKFHHLEELREIAKVIEEQLEFYQMVA